jgi:hypothetical protein
MNMHDDQQPAERDDGDLVRLLATIGPRSQPSVQATTEVRAVVEGEWRKIVAARQQRRRLAGWAAAASVAATAVALWLARPLYQPEAGPVASLARVVGDVQIGSGDGRWAPLAAGGAIEPGAVIRTGSGGRAALEMRNGVGLRLDSGTQLAFNDSNDATLSRGAVYVDSGPADGAQVADFLLETPVGSVRHLGTQYEARLTGGDLRVGIREGRVEISGAQGAVLGSAGELLTIGDGSVSRTRLAATASDWSWVAEVTPPFSIEGRSVDEFLSWAGRETGRTVVYASPDAERRARNVTLRGTVEGLAPEQAVAAVLSTTSLRPIVDGDQIRIDSMAR